MCKNILFFTKNGVGCYRVSCTELNERFRIHCESWLEMIRKEFQLNDTLFLLHISAACDACIENKKYMGLTKSNGIYCFLLLYIEFLLKFDF